MVRYSVSWFSRVLNLFVEKLHPASLTPDESYIQRCRSASRAVEPKAPEVTQSYETILTDVSFIQTSLLLLFPHLLGRKSWRSMVWRLHPVCVGVCIGARLVLLTVVSDNPLHGDGAAPNRSDRGVSTAHAEAKGFSDLGMPLTSAGQRGTLVDSSWCAHRVSGGWRPTRRPLSRGVGIHGI